MRRGTGSERNMLLLSLCSDIESPGGLRVEQAPMTSVEGVALVVLAIRHVGIGQHVRIGVSHVASKHASYTLEKGSNCQNMLHSHAHRLLQTLWSRTLLFLIIVGRSLQSSP